MNAVISPASTEPRGFAPDDRREPVLLLHASASSALQWRALADRLGARFRVLAPDLYGYGSGPAWPGHRAFALADEAALVAAQAERLGQPVHVVGHDYGGAVALHIARTRPALVRSLSLYEPAAFHLLRGGDPQDEAALAQVAGIAGAVAHSLSTGDYAGGAEQFTDSWGGEGAWSGLPPARQAEAAACMAKVALDLHAEMREAATPAELERLGIPTLLMRGDQSPPPFQRVFRRLDRAMRDRLHTESLRGAGHMGPVTHRDGVNAWIAAHLEACAGARRLSAARG